MASSLRRLGVAAVLAALFAIHGDVTAQQAAQQTPRQPAQPAGQQPAGQPAGAQQPGTDPNQPVFRTGINFVRVDVIITDKSGNAVGDLQGGIEEAELLLGYKVMITAESPVAEQP